MRAAAIFARVSSKDQAADDRMSLPAQLRVCRDYCEREGWSVVREFELPGETAWRDLDERPLMLGVLKELESRQFDVLVVQDSSRLARNVRADIEIRERLERAGVELVDLASPISLKNAEGKLVRGQLAGVQAYWSDKISDKSRLGYDERFANGLPCGAIPFGYISIGNTDEPPVIVQMEADAIREAFEDYAGGIKGYMDIARDWNQLGLRPRSKSGNTTFANYQVSKILRNPFYAGTVVHKGRSAPGSHGPIISQELFDAVRNRQRTMPHKRPRRGAMLSGLLRCAHCRGSYWTTGAVKPGPPQGAPTRYHYYIEASRPKAGSHACPVAGRLVRSEIVDGQVESAVRAMGMDDAWLDHVSREARKIKRPNPSSDRERLIDERKRVTDAYTRGVYSLDEWEARLRTIEAHLAALPPDITAAVVAGQKLRSFAELWDGATPGWRQETCRILFTEIQLDADRPSDALLAPHDDFLALFESRREFLVGGPRQG